MSLLLLAAAFAAGALFGAFIAFILATRSYDQGYSDALALATGKNAEPIEARPPEQIDISRLVGP